MGFSSIQTLAHSLEHVLNLMRECTLIPTSEIMDVMLRAADLLRNMINDINNSNNVDVGDFVIAFEPIANDDSAVAPAEAASADTAAPEAPPALSDDAAPASDESQTAAASDTAQPDAEPARAKPSQPAQGKPPAATASAPKSSPQPVESSIRVSVDVLDRVMNLAGELVLGRNQLVQTVTSEDRFGIENVATNMDQITSELQEAIMKTRLQPIGNVFGKFTRVVRDLSNQLGKKCDLSISGKEVKVDKTVIEAMATP